MTTINIHLARVQVGRALATRVCWADTDLAIFQNIATEAMSILRALEPAGISEWWQAYVKYHEVHVPLP